MVFISFGTGISNIFLLLQEDLQLLSRPNAPTLLQSKFLPLFLCRQYLSGISSTTNDASSFVGPALAT